MVVKPVSADLLIKIALAGAVALALVYVVKKAGSAAGDAASAVADLGKEALSGAYHYAGDAVSAVDNTVANVVVGAGGLVGIPATDNDQCSLDLAAGRMWDASFSCPASRFIKGAFQ